MHISNKCSIAIHCLIFIHEYEHETKVTSELLSLSTGCNPVTIRNLLSALKKDGILTVKPGAGGAAFAVPPEDITLYRICNAVDPGAIDKMVGIHAAPSPFCPVGRNIRVVLDDTYETLRADMIASMKSVTMDKILVDYHEKIQKKPGISR